MKSNANGGAAVNRRSRWKAAKASSARPRSRLAARIGWSLASVALLAALGFLVVPPLFVWHAAVVHLSVDEHALGMLAPLPFAGEDAAAVDQSLAGLLSPAVGDRPRHPLTLGQFDTAAALRDPLREKMAGLRLGARDVLVALVRGQTVAAADGAGATRAWLIPEDSRGSRGLTAEFVPCRDIVSAFAATPARTTLVALDMGDLSWDPRLGVVGGLVPVQLDVECREPLAGFGGDRTCWILGSHDAHEFSGVSHGGRRSFFSRSLELGLSGHADDPRWGEAGGDGDGVVELDELARFTAAWTSAWARRESNGEFDQRPVLWRMGSGRVPLTEIPRGIPIIRVGRPASARLPTALIRAHAADEQVSPQADSSAVPAASGTPASPPARPAGAADAPVPAGPPPPVTVWDLLDRVASAPVTEGPAAIDFAPHLWREMRALAAAAVSTPRDQTPLSRRAEDVEKRLLTGLERFLAGGDQANDGDDPLRRLFEARRSAAAAGLPAAWMAMPADVRTALAVRNRGLEMADSVTDWISSASGSGVVAPLDRPVRNLIERLRALEAELAPLAQGGREEPAGLDRLAQRRQAADAAAAALRREVDAAVESVLGRIGRGQDRLPTADLRWLLTSPLTSGVQRSRIAAAVAAKERSGTDQPGDEQPGKEKGAGPSSVGAPGNAKGTGQAADIARWLPLDIAGVAVPAEPRKPPEGAWRQVADRIGLARQLVASSRGRDEGDQSLEAAVVELARDGDSSLRLEAAVRAGGLLADRLARIPEEIDAALRGRSASPLRTSVAAPANIVDSLLRSCDPRDAARVRGDALGWVPQVKTAAPLDLAITTPDRQLETASDRRVTVALASGATFPEAGTLTLEFDPAALRVRAVGGDVIEPGRGIPREQFTGSDRLLLDVSARRRAAGPDRDKGVPLKGLLAVGPRRGDGELSLQLPIIEQLVVAVRGQPGTVEEGAEQPDRWRRISLDPLASGQEPGLSSANASAAPWGLVRLRPFPGHVTGWDLAVFNKSGAPRRVAVDLVTLAPPTPLTADAGRPAEPTGRREDEAFALLASSLARRLPLPPGMRLVSSLQELELPDSDQRIDIFLPGPKPPSAPPPGQPATGQAAAPKPEPLGATLALVIRDLVAGQEPAGAKEGATQVRGLPREKARVWLVRLPLIPQHPRRYIDAVGTWQRDDRSVTLDVRPRGSEAALLPRGGAKLAAAPLVSAAVRGQPIDMKIVAGLVSAAQPRGVLRAQWNGVDDDAAWLAVDVDGHPRARVFRVQCAAADVGVEQRPQEDWRQVEIVAPASDLQPFKAPADRIPLTVAVDGPPDAFGGGGGVVELSVREVRNLAGGIPDTGRVVWAVDSDRQVAFAHEEPMPPAAIAVSTVVSDWRVELADLGFQDVDVIAEARLKLPGDAAVRTASRTLVLDASPPRVTVLPRLRAEKGKPATLAIRPADGLESSPAVGGRRSGSSGIDRVEWAVDAKLTGAPEKWEPAAAGADGEYRADVATENLQIGRYRLVVRAFDRVGFESRPAFSELEVVMPAPAATPGATTVDTRNAIVGRVTLGGRPQPGVSVTIDGPGGPPPVTSGPDGSFTAGGLEPGEYRVSVPETTVKNRLYKAAPQPVVVAPAPAKPATVTVTLE
jgi:hypothetical protein